MPNRVCLPGLHGLVLSWFLSLGVLPILQSACNRIILSIYWSCQFLAPWGSSLLGFNLSPLFMALILIFLYIWFRRRHVNLDGHICVRIQLMHLLRLLRPRGRYPLAFSICKCRCLLFAVSANFTYANFASTRAYIIEHERTWWVTNAAHVQGDARARIGVAQCRSIAMRVNKVWCLFALALIRRQPRPRDKAEVWLVAIYVCQIVDQCGSLWFGVCRVDGLIRLDTPHGPRVFHVNVANQLGVLKGLTVRVEAKWGANEVLSFTFISGLIRTGPGVPRILLILAEIALFSLFLLTR
jgi:hypothetical protein